MHIVMGIINYGVVTSKFLAGVWISLRSLSEDQKRYILGKMIKLGVVE